MASRHRGFYGIGVFHPRHSINVGTLWRSAMMFRASFLFTIGPGFKQQRSDTLKAWRHVPMFTFEDYDALVKYLPFSCPVIGIELVKDAQLLTGFSHPERACYLLGAEDHGLPEDVLHRCHQVVQIPTAFQPGPMASLNVATAGTILMYDRFTKNGGRNHA